MRSTSAGSAARSAGDPANPPARAPRGGDDRDRDTAELCHDLRQPAATIAAMAAAALVDRSVPEAARRWLERIVTEAARITQMCQEVLGQGERWGPVAVHRLAAEVAEAARLTGGATVSLRAAPAFVVGSAASLRRATWNLVENAARAAGPGGRVVVDVRITGDQALVRVEDAGPGFGQGPGGVTGLGLSIASRIAREHGGTLALGASEELGGAAVTLALPLDDGEIGG